MNYVLPRFDPQNLSDIERRADGTEGPEFDFDDAELTINGVTFHVIADGKRTLKASTVWDSYTLEWMIEELVLGGETIDSNHPFYGLGLLCIGYIEDPAIQEIIEARYGE